MSFRLCKSGVLMVLPLLTGISSLSCQVQGMNLDSSGAPDTQTGSILKAK
jgi:hypothetical protein